MTSDPSANGRLEHNPQSGRWAGEEQSYRRAKGAVTGAGVVTDPPYVYEQTQKESV